MAYDAFLAPRTTYRIGGPAHHVFLCNSIDEVQNAMSFGRRRDLPWFILGNGSNILVADAGFPGLAIKLIGGFKEVYFDEGLVEVGSGVLLPALCSQLMTRGWGGFEFMCGIPGTVGGAVRINAGTKASKTEDHFISTKILSENGRIRTLSKKEMRFDHRTSRLALTQEIVLSAKFKLPYSESPELIMKKVKGILSDRKRRQPKIRRNCGSVFKNPPGRKSAGWYIDQAGLKGLRVGDAMVAHEHANWIVNLGSARAEDVKDLIRRVQDQVFKNFGVVLEREVIFVPEDVLGV